MTSFRPLFVRALQLATLASAACGGKIAPEEVDSWTEIDGRDDESPRQPRQDSTRPDDDAPREDVVASDGGADADTGSFDDETCGELRGGSGPCGVYQRQWPCGEPFQDNPDSDFCRTYCGTSSCYAVESFSAPSDLEGQRGLLCGFCGGGRRHRDYKNPAAIATSRELHYWLTLSHLEAVSVDAFELLASELRAHHAPLALIERALQARDDEAEHARMAADLASRRGAPDAHTEPSRDRSVRPLLAVLLENAREGCARETLAALTAAWQAQHAVEAEVRGFFARIAEDERRHAELSWDIWQWGRVHLDVDERAEVEQALANELDVLHAELARSEAQPALGLPPARIQRTLLNALRAGLPLDHEGSQRAA